MHRSAKAMIRMMAATTLVILGTTSVSWAGLPVPVPEIDPATGAAAVGLIAGAVLIMRARRKKV